MKYRAISIFNGDKFKVPQHIVRLDSRQTHGWQLRYGKWKMFSDHTKDGSGAKASLSAATEELMRRIDALHAPTGLRKDILSWKSTQLPLGISGPVGTRHHGRAVLEYHFAISVPRFGLKSTTKQVYIGTENTITDERVKAALAKAVEIRNKGEREYQYAATKTKREKSRKKESA